ncbi:MAG: hypothetical protein HY063_08015 [Bacteroidetes bacterium]|nr:hypothetical protein [Bacteroidota bacterium]
MKSNPKIFLIITFCLLAVISRAQNVKDSSLFFPMLKFSYAAQLPGGDLAKRFGWNSNIGLDFSFKTKSKLIFGAGGSFFFGNRIKEKGILDSLRTSSGFIINQNGKPANVKLFERGFTVAFHIGKMFNVLSPNKNSGIVFYAGPVFMRHKITIYDVGKQSPQLTSGYLKGYDRLTAGMGAQEFIGYVYLGNTRILNFFAGFEFTQAFTKSWRGYDYDLMKADTERRTDLLYGFRAGWILPLYKRTPQEFYYH